MPNGNRNDQALGWKIFDFVAKIIAVAVIPWAYTVSIAVVRLGEAPTAREIEREHRALWLALGTKVDEDDVPSDVKQRLDKCETLINEHIRRDHYGAAH